MGLITAVLVFFGALAGSVFSKLIADEAKAWLPHITERLLRRAIKRLPDAEQERYAEEWSAYLHDTPGDLGKLLTALGLQIAAARMGGQIPAQRVLDIALSVVMLVASLPLMFLVALLIKLESNGPILLMQRRIGLNEQPFNLFKFRTIDLCSTPQHVALTPFGRFLQRTSIDKLPQIINVLHGDMSLLGRRARRPGETH